MSPEEVPSPPGNAVADLPSSPIAGVGSTGLERLHGPSAVVDLNNNHTHVLANNSNMNGFAGFNSRCLIGEGMEAADRVSDDPGKHGHKSQNFKRFLEVRIFPMTIQMPYCVCLLQVLALQ
jgi:hypothetical protein